MQTTTFIALAALLLVPLASAGGPDLPPEPDCVSIYRPITSEPVAVTLVNGCTVEVEVTTGQNGCQERYVAYDLGTVRFESRDSCHYELRAGAAYPDLGLGAAPAAPEGPSCYYIYREYDLVVVTLIQYSTCSYGVRFNDPPTALVTTDDGAGDWPCMDRYATYGDPETVYVVSRSTCQYEVFLFGEPLLEQASGTDGGPEPTCLYYYKDEDYGIVRYQMVSSCETHLWVAGEQVF